MNGRTRQNTGETEREIRVEIPSRLEELSKIERLAQTIAHKFRLSTDKVDNLAIAMTEAVGNAIVHGNGRNPGKMVRIAYWQDSDMLRIRVEDQGKGFDPEAISDPLAPENLMKEHGRGIFILRNLMDEVRFSFSSKGTVVHMAIHIGERLT
jgi:serine/threonine-protein kinase RsbW